MAYYTSETCGYVNNNNYVDIGCTTDYASSEIKHVVDVWKDAEVQGASEARLITYDELTDNLGYEKKNEGTIYPSSSGITPSWVYNSNYYYWTMTTHNDSPSQVWSVFSDGDFKYDGYVNHYTGVVRPIITLSKTELGDIDESVIDEIGDEIDENDNKIDIDKDSKVDKVEIKNNNETNTSSKVKVENTYMSNSITIILVGFIISVLSILMFYKYINTKV